MDVSGGSAVFEVTARLMVKEQGLPAKTFIGPALFTIDSFGDITDVEFSFTPVQRGAGTVPGAHRRSVPDFTPVFETGALCFDGLDNDCDGLVDAADGDCFVEP